MRRLLPLALGFSALVALPFIFPPQVREAKASFENAAVPKGRTPKKQLAPDGLTHHEVLRIDPDVFGPKTYDIVLDGWTRDASKPEIAELRLWWLDRAKSDERSPFGKGVRRQLKIDYTPKGRDEWTVVMAQGGNHYRFDVKLDRHGELQAYGDVLTNDGTLYKRCRAIKSRLKPRLALGIPTGLAALEVTCIDDEGKRQRGKLQPR